MVQNLLYPVDFRPWVSFGLALLRTFGGFSLDRHINICTSNTIVKTFMEKKTDQSFRLG